MKNISFKQCSKVSGGTNGNGVEPPKPESYKTSVISDSGSEANQQITKKS
ncbi:hypothetical protein [Pseudoalteromonas maricaloris]|nr:hypothetical protein [Pseudoalteromonas flavipulchra]MBE0372358.1 hypothetical protein [Pseudoalteromonas flavipulchra NCIMB 2033 = ATCC BAA-314]